MPAPSGGWSPKSAWQLQGSPQQWVSPVGMGFPPGMVSILPPITHLSPQDRLSSKIKFHEVWKRGEGDIELAVGWGDVAGTWQQCWVSCCRGVAGGLPRRPPRQPHPVWPRAAILHPALPEIRLQVGAGACGGGGVPLCRRGSPEPTLALLDDPEKARGCWVEAVVSPMGLSPRW